MLPEREVAILAGVGRGRPPTPRRGHPALIPTKYGTNGKRLSAVRPANFRVGSSLLRPEVLRPFSPCGAGSTVET